MHGLKTGEPNVIQHNGRIDKNFFLERHGRETREVKQGFMFVVHLFVIVVCFA